MTTLSEVLPEYIQVLALVTAGVWAYWRFVHQRSHEPATDIEVDVTFVGIQGPWWVVEVTAILENKSLVRHNYGDFRMNLRFLTADDTLKDAGPGLNFQLQFPHSIDERICGQRRFFPRAEYINPRQQFRHRYVSFIPAEATFVRVHSKFEFEPVKSPGLRRRSRRSQDMIAIDSQRVFRVPGHQLEVPLQV